ncbi:hypothetical protein CEXT_751961 [Caerostris extrusa]|uniref:Uncharacterized protein n=1 Tax=Caerostris extrusa TaxID=172846 RepID=A0AAV4TKL7_CAEEX|nr:hypothetical protein CEXT_751961 [Caerostris extrusa]
MLLSASINKRHFELHCTNIAAHHSPDFLLRLRRGIKVIDNKHCRLAFDFSKGQMLYLHSINKRHFAGYYYQHWGCCHLLPFRSQIMAARLQLILTNIMLGFLSDFPRGQMLFVCLNETNEILRCFTTQHCFLLPVIFYLLLRLQIMAIKLIVKRSLCLRLSIF